VHIEGAEIYPSRGRFLLMTVVAEPASLLYCFYTLFDPAAQLTLKVRPQAQDGAAEDAWQMSLSQSVSSQIALDYVLQTHPERAKGLLVVQGVAQSPNAGQLREGDILTALAGQPVRHLRDIAQILQARPVRAPLAATIERAGKTLRIPLQVWHNGPRRMLGFRFSPILQDNGRPLNIHIDSERVGGASGGLVFCLELIDQLLPEDLTRGRIIAATGTLDRRARVGPVEGAAFKRIAAQRAGAQIFLCPRDVAAQLQGPGPQVVGVSSLQEALQVLRAKPPP
jgi:PDZ domain-containing protein